MRAYVIIVRRVVPNLILEELFRGRSANEKRADASDTV
jgi:hypothetical protein